MDRLEPCPSCQRHVRISESRCPFCAANVEALGALAAREMPTKRLGRAALFAFGVSAAAAAGNTVACTDEPDPDSNENIDESTGAGKDAGVRNDAGASAGGAGTSDAGASADAGSNGGSTRFDAGSVVALYGLALPGGDAAGGQPGGAFVPDASKPSDPVKPDAGRAKDAGPGADLGGAVALYGLAPAPDAGRDAGIIRRDAGGFVPLYGLPITDPSESSS
jgi:hypothetical protein